MSSNTRDTGMESSNESLHTLLDGVVIALDIVKDAAAAFPPLQSAIEGVAGIILDVVKKMGANIDQIKLLGQHASQLSITLQNPIFKNEKACPEDLRRRIDILERQDHSLDIYSQLKETTKEIREPSSSFEPSPLSRSDTHAGTIDEHITNISRAIEVFLTGGTMNVEVGVNEILSRLDKLRLDEKQAFVGPAPHYAIAARFDYPSQRVTCEGRTRSETLNAIYQWFLLSQGEGRTPEAAPQPPRVEARLFLLTGQVGSGKSTIAQTVAAWCSEHGCLGASFFCSRGNRECSDIQMIFPTIAYQLGQWDRRFQEKTAEVLRQDPDIQTSLVSNQLRRLIVDPLRELPTFPDCAIVIDALDECKDSEATSLIVRALSEHASDLAPLKIFLTSRPVPNITHGFHSTGLLDAAQHIILHEVPSDTTERDIDIFLQKRLADVRERYGLDRSWHSAERAARLLELSNRLFIYPATAMRFIEDANASDPDGRLRLLLEGQGASPAGVAMPFYQLDELYLQVLKSAYPNMTQELKSRLKIILGTLVLIRDRLSPDAIDKLMLFEHRTTRTALTRLQSVVMVPDDDDAVISLIHPSFHDFLTDDNRCHDPDLSVHPATQHGLIAQRCLETMIGGLRTDICGIGRSVPNSEVPMLSELVAEHIPPSLQYASLHWTHHALCGEINNELLDVLTKFGESHLLNWLEVLSLLGELSGAISALQMLHDRLLGLPLTHSNIIALLYDCLRAAQQSFPGLSISCLQAHSDLVPFCPTSSRLRDHYAGQGIGLPRVLSGLQQHWDPCTLTIEGHANSVTAACFSPNGRRIVSASADNTVKLWDAITGLHLHTLQGDEDVVRLGCAAFSSNGRYIASSSDVKTIIIWDATTGQHLRTVKGHTDWITAVDFSLDGDVAILASGSHDYSVRIWDINSDVVSSRTLSPAHKSFVKCVRFSQGGTLLVSCSEDGACKVWKSGAWTCIAQFDHPERTAIFSVAISPDETIFASGQGRTANDIILHSTVDGHCLRTLQGHTSSVWSLDFSPDGATLASGSSDHTIILWDVAGGSTLHTLKGHSREVLSVRYSPDGQRITSCGGDQSVRIWDLSLLSAERERESTRKELKERLTQDRESDMHRSAGAEPQRPSNVRSVTFSSDGQILATGSGDTTIRLWDTASGTQLRVLEGHQGVVSYLSFSPDGKKLLSSEYKSDASESALRLWDVESGCCEQIFTGHEDDINQAKFFPDGKQVISCSDNGSIRVWEVGQSRTRSAESRVVYHSQSLSIVSIAVSPDASLVAFGCWSEEPDDHILGLVSLTTSQAVHLVRYERAYGPPTALAFSTDSSRLLVASGAESSRVTLWGVQAGGPAGSTLADIAPEATFLDCYDGGDCAESIAFSSSERSFITDATMDDISPQHWPRSASQDDHAEYAFCLADNWLWYISATERRRLCWVPSTFRLMRHYNMVSRGSIAVHRNLVAFGTEGGRVIILDMTPCLYEYSSS
ncbi:uncharacterized protein PHACADRAFT_211976 [Phanerochaete carnosa HHB-10118-sp]|uniref:Nephrocystin 3-like N-terminal domain-containing protein n=1 Tax=Phanerochaete carnosa (strain HHB-10118-sp) TaxID=650164 RepID=K5WQW9_PHACS|nr:uncharacterized protein PHACADRAFT_211976 [Phanerochaete carnosa HHB-10118-sp]EKM52762.1 hypothetical protein PHACADRAFT_211976 [Phanerochaete carnosa HHB-10118-sp]